MTLFNAEEMKPQDLLFNLHLDDVDLRTLMAIPPWRRIALDPEWRGPWIVAGDVDGDGQCELVNARADERDDKHPIASACVYKLDGSILWHWGDPKKGTNTLHSDIACQIFDWDGDGKAEVILGTETHLVALDGCSGRELFRHPIPKDAHDCITFAYLDGPGRPAAAIIKNRYWDLWAMDRDGTIRWHWAPPENELTAHQPYPVDLDGDGKEELIAGFYAIDGEARTLWSLEQAGINGSKGHLDCTRAIRLDKPPGTHHLLMTLCGGNGIICVDLQGRRQWAHDGLHYESIDVGRLHPELSGLQFAVDITHGRKPYQDPLQCIDATGRIFGQIWGMRVRQHFNIDWLGNGFEQIVIPSDLLIVDASRGKAIRGLVAPQPENLVPLREEKAREAEHALFGEYLYMGFCGDVLGNGRQDIVLHTNPGTCVWIYENTTGESKKRKPGPVRNYTLY